MKKYISTTLMIAIQAFGLMKERFIGKWQGICIVVGLLLLNNPDIEFISSIGALLTCAGYIPWGIRNLQGRMKCSSIACPIYDTKRTNNLNVSTHVDSYWNSFHLGNNEMKIKKKEESENLHHYVVPALSMLYAKCKRTKFKTVHLRVNFCSSIKRSCLC
jgi:hypothetical protein